MILLEKVFAKLDLLKTLKVFAYIASAYVMWKTILGGPDWTFRLMGINNSSSDVITEDVGRRMESKTFMV
ncbi:TPA: hypothetical protein ACHDWT_001771 [Campylobacter coli]